METRKISTLKINTLVSQEQYDKAYNENKIEQDSIYLVPDDTEEITQQKADEALQSAKEYSDSIVGNLSDYWNVGLQISDVMSAINSNANWVNGSFEKVSDRVQNLFDYSTDESKHPSAKATYDLMKFVYDLVMPVKIYDDPTGFEATNSNVGDWQLNNLDLTPYKRLKFYVKAGGDSNDNRTPMHIVEMHLDDRCKNSIGFTAGHLSVNPNNRNRIHCVTFAVNEAKTAVQFVAANSLYGTASTSSSGDRNCYLIEGYYI